MTAFRYIPEYSEQPHNDDVFNASRYEVAASRGDQLAELHRYQAGS